MARIITIITMARITGIIADANAQLPKINVEQWGAMC